MVKIEKGVDSLDLLKRFLFDEKGSTLEYLLRTLIIGLGSLAILFGILIALRHQGGVIIENIKSLNF